MTCSHILLLNCHMIFYLTLNDFKPIKAFFLCESLTFSERANLPRSRSEKLILQWKYSKNRIEREKSLRSEFYLANPILYG